LKILVIPDKTPEMNDLRKNIVTFNNSQNAIDQKTFEANSDQFKRLQIEFRKKGFLVCIKQSDKYKFTKEEFKTPVELMNLNHQTMEKFGLSSLHNTKDFLIPLDKLLQVILAYSTTALSATLNKSKLLISGSEQNKQVIDFIRRNDVTINDLISLWLLYQRADFEKNSKGEGRMPIPLFLIHCLNKYECEGDPTKISSLIASPEAINRLMNLYRITFVGYFKEWQKNNDGLGYNDMIKKPIDYALMDKSREMALSMMSMM